MARHRPHARPERPKRAERRGLGEPGSHVGRVGGADPNGDGVRSLADPERPGDAGAARCEGVHAADPRANGSAGTAGDAATDATLDDRDHTRALGASHADPDLGLHARADARTDAGTNAGTDA